MPLVPLLLSLAAVVGALICQIRADQRIHQNVNMEEVLVMTTYGSMLYLSVIILLLLLLPVLFHGQEKVLGLVINNKESGSPGRLSVLKGWFGWKD
jgi:hypothetical protein